MRILILAALAYLIGSIPFAIVSSRLFGLSDPRTFGSGNPGATNVLRSGNKSAAVVTLLGDAAKGWQVVWLAYHFAPTLALQSYEIALLALAVFLGHVFSVFLGFKGGKGVATALGVLLGVSWPLALIVLALWLLVALTTRLSSLAAICAAFAAPCIACFTLPTAITLFGILPMSLVLIWRHKANIGRLLKGTETRIGARG